MLRGTGDNGYGDDTHNGKTADDDDGNHIFKATVDDKE